MQCKDSQFFFPMYACRMTTSETSTFDGIKLYHQQLSLVNDEEVISLSHAKVYVFLDSVLCLGKVNQNPTSNPVWEDKLSWFKDSPPYRTLDTIDGEPMEFE